MADLIAEGTIADASSATQIVAGTASSQIRVKEYLVSIRDSSTGSLNITLQDDEATPIVIVGQQAVSPATGPLRVRAQNGFIAQCTSGADLDILASAAGTIAYRVVYDLEAD